MANANNNYPKSRSTGMTKVKPIVLGDAKRMTTANGPHLLQGKGTMYNQGKITTDFVNPKPHVGHTQRKNVDGAK